MAKKKRKRSKADETDSSSTGHPRQDDAKPETTPTEGSDATGSHKPADASVPTEAEETEDEYILVREPDGRYRIVGRRPTKP